MKSPFESSDQVANAPPSLAEVRERLTPFCLRQPVQKLEVFGSVARGEGECGSDVDLMITFLPGTEVPFEEFSVMREEIEQILDCRVDLMERSRVEAHRNEIRRRHMLRGARTIYAKT